MKRLATKGVLLLIALVVLPGLLGAQQQMRRVTGHVTLQGAGVASGVQVSVLGTTLGALTDDQGNFTLQVPESATTLVFTYIGYRTMEAPIQDHVEVTLHQEAIGLEGVVVTAMGIQREQRTIPFLSLIHI